MKKNGIFVISILLLLLFWQWAFFELKGHFNGLKETRFEVAALKEQIQRASVRTELVQYQFDLFRQQVAKILPSMKQPESPGNYLQQRGLASVVQQPSEEFLMLAQFESTVEELRTLFEQRRYKQVIRKAKNILALNPVSPSLVTVYFILAESYFQSNELDSCLVIAQQMTRLFPEQEKTGYVLLRVGLFLKEKNRIEEARNMFSLVAHAFADEKLLKAQSEKLLASIGGAE
jgi:tetratricopeptide (TPR) repeat protein